MKKIVLRALLLLGWLGITAGGGAMLRAQQKVVYDQYFYFNSFETDADLEGWTCQRPYGGFYTDGVRGIGSVEGSLLSPKFDLRGMKKPVISVDIYRSMPYSFWKILISEDGRHFREIFYEKKGKVGRDAYRYLIPVPDTVFQIKFLAEERHHMISLDAFSIYDREDDIPLSEKAFYCDFDRESDMQGWQHDGQRWGDNSGSGGLIENFSYLITPELDLAEMHDPVLTFSVSAGYFGGKADTLGFFISTDGMKYDTLFLQVGSSRYSLSYYRLPRSTKRVKLQMINKRDYYSTEAYHICIREADFTPYLDEPQPVALSWLIPEDNGGLKWEKKDGGFVLKGTAQAGTIARLILPNTFGPSYAFSLKNVDPTKVKVEFNNTDISALTGEIVQEAYTDRFSYLKITSIDGSPVEVTVSDFRLLMTLSSSYRREYAYQPQYWYDDLPDNEMMEFEDGYVDVYNNSVHNGG